MKTYRVTFTRGVFVVAVVFRRADSKQNAIDFAALNVVNPYDRAHAEEVRV